MRKRKTWIWILCAVLAVCIVVVCIVVFTRKDSTAKKPSQITTDEGASQDKQDANGSQNLNAQTGANGSQNANAQPGANGGQNGGNASGGAGNNSLIDDGAADIDYPYVDMPAEQDDGDTPGASTGGDIPDNSSGGNSSGGDSSGGAGQGSGGTTVDGNGDIVLPMVP